MYIVLRYILLLQCLNIIKRGQTKMPVYCMESLNTSDCKQTPKNVFSYYKLGSRCELEVWRGCPSSNKFDTEEECSDTCIFRNIEVEIKETKHKENDKCLYTEELTECDEKLHHVFKYSPVLKDCVEVETSCVSPNVFEEKLDCIETCVRELSWEEKLKLTSDRQIKELDSILENLFNETTGDGDSSQSIEATEDGNTSYTGTSPTLAGNSTNDGDKTPATDPAKKLEGDENTSNTTGLNNNTVTTLEEIKKMNAQDNVETEQSTEKATRKAGTVPMVEIK
ncbi:uncharacterized protein LOC116767523 [Danaus plexippus]|uniref:uncharacterized protein LOC116767523 n=1 Tax=Danaus plexippus TaxID=13037 RepID=UPI002AAF59CF|nr:uncharacterized protein LOC116767523 [Danaus plexippus]